MKRSNNFSGYKEDYSHELSNFGLKFFAEPPSKGFPNLRKQELNKRVEHRQSNTDKKETTNWSVSTFRGK